MVSPGSTKHRKRNWNREIYYSQVLEEVHSILPGTRGEGQVKVQAEREGGPGTHAFMQLRVEGFGKFPG